MLCGTVAIKFQAAHFVFFTHTFAIFNKKAVLLQGNSAMQRVFAYTKLLFDCYLYSRHTVGIPGDATESAVKTEKQYLYSVHCHCVHCTNCTLSVS